MNSVRVRFAPSPTGPLHIGGLRTALYNYLFAKNEGGTFILRIEDTDQKRYVEGAEDYIRESLRWAGIQPSEGPEIGGGVGPYRQSERREIYATQIQTLIDNSAAYYAFDTVDEIAAMRSRLEAEGVHSPKYSHETRMSMRNSLTLPQDQVDALLAKNVDYTIRLKVEPGQKIVFNDEIREEVRFDSSELDDKVLMKSDGLPTYHLANVVDDYLMKISHVIRGEEWLSSTAHHVLLYRAFGWEVDMPKFAHLPLIMKPTGKGKLSKRDGLKLSIPVFPMDWQSDEGLYAGFKELGFLPAATLNFLAFLGWNPGTEQEIFDLDALSQAFSLNQVSKSGARFDYDKAKWYNQQYLLGTESSALVPQLSQQLADRGIERSKEFLITYIDLFKQRLESLNDLYSVGSYFFEDVQTYNEKMIRKKWNDNCIETFKGLVKALHKVNVWKADILKSEVENVIVRYESSFGAVLPILRIAVSGDVKGADIFKTMELMTKDLTLKRLSEAPTVFNDIINRT